MSEAPERSRRARWIGSIAAVALASCAPTARTPGPYRAHAIRADEAVHSAVASDLLVIHAAAAGHTTAAYVSEATSQAEDDAASAASSFLSIQPPDDQSEKLRTELSTLFDRAQSALGDARIAGRRGDTDALTASASDLEQVAKRLVDFLEANQ
jgi:phosphate uptake regulator